jgi:hypothetical protein
MVAKTMFLVLMAFVLSLSACNLPAGAPGSPVPAIAPVAVLTAAAECWSGPGEGYPVAAALSPGQSADVVGRTPDGAYLLVRDPANPAVMCWINTAMTTVVGELVSVQVYVVPAPLTLVSGCPSPVDGGPTPVSCSTYGGPAFLAGCPSPVGGGPTPVVCSGGGNSAPAVGCPSPIGGGPTPVNCSPYGGPPFVAGCPSPVGGGPTPVVCSGGGNSAPAVGCPSPVGGGPTPVSCSGSGGSAPVYGCPSPIGGGPTPVSCSGSGGAPSSQDPPTPLPLRKQPKNPTPVWAPTAVGAPTAVQ